MLIARGVTVLAPSGSTWQGTLPGLSMHTELELLVHAGLTPRAALAAATGNYVGVPVGVPGTHAVTPPSAIPLT